MSCAIGTNYNSCKSHKYLIVRLRKYLCICVNAYFFICLGFTLRICQIEHEFEKDLYIIPLLRHNVRVTITKIYC